MQNKYLPWFNMLSYICDRLIPPPPSEDIERGVMRLTADHINEHLSGIQTLILSMRFGVTTPDGSEMTLKEIARNLGMSESNVRAHIKRARHTLGHPARLRLIPSLRSRSDLRDFIKGFLPGIPRPIAEHPPWTIVVMSGKLQAHLNQRGLKNVSKFLASPPSTSNSDKLTQEYRDAWIKLYAMQDPE